MLVRPSKDIIQSSHITSHRSIKKHYSVFTHYKSQVNGTSSRGLAVGRRGVAVRSRVRCKYILVAHGVNTWHEHFLLHFSYLHKSVCGLFAGDLIVTGKAPKLAISWLDPNLGPLAMKKSI